jgi:hypothetical protein
LPLAAFDTGYSDVLAGRYLAIADLLQRQLGG